MCPSHPEVNRLMSSLRHFTSQSTLILPSPSGRWYFLSDIHSVLIHGSFLEISLKYFVFISSVEICIYMFNKTRYDLLCVPPSLLTLFHHFVFTVRADGPLRK